tara:strand:- start:19817 stop:20755 length:939 start_codon:yes stop_codon:yes gene_type:complete
MKNFCTLSDVNFLPFGLALHDSLKRNFDDDFKLFYLCTDDASYDKLNRLKIDSIVPLSLTELTLSDKSLSRARENQPSYEAVNVANRTGASAKEIQYFWCLSPYLSWHILDNYDIEDVLYVDSDIYFFNNLKKIYDEIGNKSVGIVRHRINYNPAVGEYNVGIVYFKNDLTGYQCSEWWKNCLLYTDHEYYKTHGICGDQKYLELFAPLFGENKVQIIDDQVGHLAPWNFANHKFLDDLIVWQGMPQEIVYCHFSNFKPDYDNDCYEAAPRHGLSKSLNLPKPVKRLYDEYFNAVKNARMLIDENRFRHDSL